MVTLKAGAASVDITPPPGLLLAGFAARSEPAIGVHDPLTARAVVIGDTAIVVADVIGISHASSARIRDRCCLPAGNVIVAATHTHGAPNSMANRLGAPADAEFLAAIEDGCVAAIDRAAASAVPAQLHAGFGADPDVARNRRHADGPLDRSLPVLRLTAEDGAPIAVVASYACHPTVLGADNRLMTSDYPHVVRTAIEAAHPGAIALFLNGCAGDANIGHAAQASWTVAANTARTFENAERLGRRIAEAALAAPLSVFEPTPTALADTVELTLDRPEGDLAAAAAVWQQELDDGVGPPRSLLLPHWVRWGRERAQTPPGQHEAHVSVIDLGAVVFVALPGEVFAESGLSIRAACGDRVAFVLAYTDDTPGYIPPASEYRFGGYEVDEAHRFVGLGGRFASGSAETLVASALRLLTMAANQKTAEK